MKTKKNTVNRDTSVTEWDYARRQRLADQYLYRKYGIGWEDLPDINSLHDCDTVGDIIDFCEERVNDDHPRHM